MLYLILSSKKGKDFELKRYFEIDREIENYECFKNVRGDKHEKIFKILFRDLEKVSKHYKNIRFDGVNTSSFQNWKKLIAPFLLYS
jgi:hypothetical protein